MVGGGVCAEALTAAFVLAHNLIKLPLPLLRHRLILLVVSPGEAGACTGERAHSRLSGSVAAGSPRIHDAVWRRYFSDWGIHGVVSHYGPRDGGRSVT